MQAAFQSRLRRYASFAPVHGLLTVLTVAGLFGAKGGLVLLVASVPLLWAFGAYQGHLAMNTAVDETERQRWRLALYLLPWSMTLYFRRYVRTDDGA